ncbi:DUF4190 domain-containing protein [Actinomadura darangshiensis]|uniref:DUF4190 domain-containing protein n=2 Tax=Actinomadura darangshiensis TaxID=705336 RepID=A0A4R5ABV7_9ACTN|nr:DUF4190 domain-containing protein [Actinomadura darangshiensis]
MAIVALALGVLGLVSCALLGAAAIPCANQAMREIQRTGERGRELAMAGLVLGSLGLTLWVVLLSVMAVLFPW